MILLYNFHLISIAIKPNAWTDWLLDHDMSCKVPAGGLISVSVSKIRIASKGQHVGVAGSFVASGLQRQHFTWPLCPRVCVCFFVSSLLPEM